jgi:hypothetical protein
MRFSCKCKGGTYGTDLRIAGEQCVSCPGSKAQSDARLFSHAGGLSSRSGDLLLAISNELMPAQLLLAVSDLLRVSTRGRLHAVRVCCRQQAPGRRYIPDTALPSRDRPIWCRPSTKWIARFSCATGPRDQTSTAPARTGGKGTAKSTTRATNDPRGMKSASVPPYAHVRLLLWPGVGGVVADFRFHHGVGFE